MPEAPPAEGGDEPRVAQEDPLDHVLAVDVSRAFPAEIPQDPNAALLCSIPPALYYPAVLAAAAAAGLAGLTAARAAPIDRDQASVLSVAVGAAAAGAVAVAGSKAKKVRDRAAVVDLFNLLVKLDDPSELTSDDVKGVGDRYGINMHKDQLQGLQQIFGQYLENIVPVGDVQLRGDEAPKIAAFKEALGLDDEDAAPVFIEVGRRLSRAGYEISNRNQQFEQRKAFQRLIYISYAVFGEQKAAFLLPWRRVFNLNDSQLFVARRDNARAIFNAHMREQYGGTLPADRTALRELRDYQTQVKLMDDVAEDSVRAASRAHIEKNVAAAVEVARASSKARDPAKIVAELQSMLEYGRKLTRLANEDDLVPGLGLPSLHGGEWEGDGKRRDVREIYRIFVEESVAREGSFTPAVDADLKELSAMLCLGAKETADVRAEVAAGLYRRLLREEVTSRRIDAAPSPAAVIADLVAKSGYSAEAAAELHRSLYRQKLTQLVAKKKLTDQDADDLLRIVRVLAIPQDAADEIMRTTAGRVLEEAISDVFLAGPKPVTEFELERVSNTARDLRLPASVAKAVLSEAARGRLKAYATQAAKDLQRDRKAAAQALKKMAQFNALVITPLLERITGHPVAGAAPAAAAAGDAAVTTGDAAGDALLAAGRGNFGEMSRPVQLEITLGDDIEEPVRAELYKAYLMYAMSGDAVELPVGGVIRKKTNLQARQQEMARLSQLGDLLGMAASEVAAVQEDLAEKAFRAQAQDVLRGTGSLSPERASYLEEMRGQLKLPKDKADKVVREVRTEILGASAALEEPGGQKWTVDKVLSAHRDGVDVRSALEEGPRRALLRREVDRRLGDGKAKFDAKLLLQELPKILDVDQRRVDALVKELVGSRKRMLLVQAVSQHRQKRGQEIVPTLNNLISVYRAMPEKAGNAGAAQWGEREEVKEIYGAYCARVDDPAKRAELADLFGLTAAERDEAAGPGTAAAGRALQRHDDDDGFF